jgi:ATP-dependent Clp protease adaptor protein ClpS
VRGVSGSLPEIGVTPEVVEEEATKTRRVPPYNVILYNDDHHSFEFVVAVLQKALGFNEQRAFLLTHTAHHEGRAVVWTGPKEVAELKVEQIQTFHETRERDGASLGPLGVSIEPAPGA